MQRRSLLKGILASSVVAPVAIPQASATGTQMTTEPPGSSTMVAYDRSVDAKGNITFTRNRAKDISLRLN